MEFRLVIKAAYEKGDDVEHIVFRSPIIAMNERLADRILHNAEAGAPHGARFIGGSPASAQRGFALLEVELQRIWGRRKAHKAATAVNDVFLYYWEALTGDP